VFAWIVGVFVGDYSNSRWLIGSSVMHLLLFLLILFASPSLSATCPLYAWDQTARLKAVNDGDTITLENGRLVRLIGINTPEVNHRKLSKSEPYALEAKALLEKYLRPGDKLHLIYDHTQKDKYGRLLAYVYSKTGRDLALLQLQHGYAQQWVIGNNDKFWRCVQKAERQARKRKKGIWQDVKVLSASRLSKSDKGYVYIRGHITAIEESKGSIKLILDRRLVVSISHSNLSRFKNNAIHFSLHDKLLITGKLTFSQDRPKVRLYHPVQILL